MTRGLLFLVWFLLGGIGIAQNGPALGEKQVVLVTDYGQIVLEVFPQEAPRHVEAFLRRVRSREYVGTLFHRAIPFGIIQGGDPLTRDRAKKDLYGTGGLYELKREFNDVSHLRGTLSAVLVPGNPDSAGAQFFICVTEQVQLNGQYTAFGRVVEGMDTVETISQLPTDDQQRIIKRVEIKAVFERERPPPPTLPFADQEISQLADYHVEVQTDLGDFELGFYTEQAPEHVRQFLSFAQLGLYDGTSFHRVVPGFVLQGGSLATRGQPIPEMLRALVRPLAAEFNQRPHVMGTLSMARGQDPNSAVDSFFIVLQPQPSLDGQYTVFGHVVDGWETVEGIAQVPLRGEVPVKPVKIRHMKVVKQAGRSAED